MQLLKDALLSCFFIPPLAAASLSAHGFIMNGGVGELGHAALRVIKRALLDLF